MDEIAFLTRLHRPGTIIDVGAHDGDLTIPLARLPGCEVIAFEPLPQAFARLEARIRAAHHGAIPGHVSLRREALGDAAGAITLEVPVVGGVAQEQWASVAKDYAAIQRADPRVDAIERHVVPMIRLDSLGLQRVTAMKVDAEGAEAEVLKGAADTLQRCRPILTVEIEERHRAGSTRDVPAFLAELGYIGRFALNGAWHGLDRFDAGTMQAASPSPAEFSASDPYVFIFCFVMPDRVAELAGWGGLA
jgi:FkbM family methyltransferase